SPPVAKREVFVSRRAGRFQPLPPPRSNEDAVVPLSIQLCRRGIPRQETSSFTRPGSPSYQFCMNRMQKEICVGVVGANKNAGWAKMSHVPAIKSLPGLKLAAVAT